MAPQYFCLKTSMDRGAWQAVVHGVAESDTVEQQSTHTHLSYIYLSTYLSVCLHTMQHSRSFPGGPAAMYYMNVGRFLKLFMWALCTPQLKECRFLSLYGMQSGLALCVAQWSQAQ